MKEKKNKKEEAPIENEEQKIEETPEDDSKVEVEINDTKDTVENDLEAKIAELENEKQELHERLLRRMAEFENFKRRTESEQANIFKFAAEPFVKDILPVYDDLERSLSHVDDESRDSLIEGLNMVMNKFGKILENHGVVRIDAKGKPFDFNYHEALMRQESADHEPDTVIDVFEQGYLYKDKVIKHAKVIVSAAPEAKEEVQEKPKEEKNNDEEK